MAYVVGHTESYDRCLIELKPAKKLGKCTLNDGTDYAGGGVFESIEDAWKYLIMICRTDIWSVYEIDADFNRDAVDEGESFRRLVNDAEILGKVKTRQP